MAKKEKRSNKKHHNHNVSKTDLPDVKTNRQTDERGTSMKQKLGER